MPKNTEQFNIVIAGVGGQGLITVLSILAEAARIENCDFASSELHGLSQRGGSVEVHIRFGGKIYSPLVKQGGADLIISLEAQESLKSCYYSSKENKTIFLVNEFFSPIQGAEKIYSAKDITEILQKFSQKSILIKASQICQKEFGTDVVAGIYLLGYAISKKILPFKEQSVILAIKKAVPENFLELNLKAFNLAKSS